MSELKNKECLGVIYRYLIDEEDHNNFSLVCKLWNEVSLRDLNIHHMYRLRLVNEFGMSFENAKYLALPKESYTLLKQYRHPSRSSEHLDIIKAYWRNVDLHPERDPLTVPWFYFPYAGSYVKAFLAHLDQCSEFILCDYLEKALRYKNTVLAKFLLIEKDVTPGHECLIQAIFSEDPDLVDLIFEMNSHLFIMRYEFIALLSTQKPDYIRRVLCLHLRPELASMLVQEISDDVNLLHFIIYPGSFLILEVLLDNGGADIFKWIGFGLDYKVNGKSLFKVGPLFITSDEEAFLLKHKVLSREQILQYTKIVQSPTEELLATPFDAYNSGKFSSNLLDIAGFKTPGRKNWKGKCFEFIMKDDLSSLKAFYGGNDQFASGEEEIQCAASCGSFSVLTYLMQEHDGLKGLYLDFYQSYHGYEYIEKLTDFVGINVEQMALDNDQLVNYIGLIYRYCPVYFHKVCIDLYPRLKGTNNSLRDFTYYDERDPSSHNCDESDPSTYWMMRVVGYQRKILFGFGKESNNTPSPSDSGEFSEDGNFGKLLCDGVIGIKRYLCMYKDKIDEETQQDLLSCLIRFFRPICVQSAVYPLGIEPDAENLLLLPRLDADSDVEEASDNESSEIEENLFQHN